MLAKVSSRSPTGPAESDPPPGRARGLTIIIAYKLIKGVLWLTFAVVILVLMHFGLESRVLGFAVHLRHTAHAWSIALGNLIAHAANRRGIFAILVALTADGVVSLVEGWALVHGRWWGPWLVVVTTASLLPFEAFAFVRHRRAIRAAVFCGNAAIVWYLARTARQHHHRSPDPTPSFLGSPGQHPPRPL
jgi:uncharacterized membrane protein (DUF2068 family)